MDARGSTIVERLSEALNTGVGVQTLAFCFVVEANGNMMTMVKTMLS